MKSESEFRLLEQCVKRAMCQEGIKRDQWRAEVPRHVRAASCVRVEVHDASGPEPEFGEPAAKIAANQVVFDLLQVRVFGPVFRIRVGGARGHAADQTATRLVTVKGNSSYVRPCSSRPVRDFRVPPHCLKKNGTACLAH